MKTCPYCAEKIQDEAVKCRFCGEFLQAEAGARVAPKTGTTTSKIEGSRTHLQDLKVSVSHNGKVVNGKLQFEGTKMFLKTLLKKIVLFDIESVTALEHRGRKLLVHVGQTQYLIDLFQLGKEAVPYKKTFAHLAQVSLAEWKPDNKKTAIIVVSIAVPVLTLLFSSLLFRFMTFMNLLALLAGLGMLFLPPIKPIFNRSQDPKNRKKVTWYQVGMTGLAFLCLVISVSIWIAHSAEEADAVDAMASTVAQSESLITSGRYEDALRLLAQVTGKGDIAHKKVELMARARNGLFEQYLARSKEHVTDKDYNGASLLLEKIDKNWSRYGEVLPVKKQISDARAFLDKQTKMKEFEESFKNIDRRIKKGKKAAAERDWLYADKSYESALEYVDQVNKASGTWLWKAVPDGFNAAAKKLEIESLRQKIARQVEKKNRLLEHDRRLTWIDQIKSTLDSNSRDTYLAAKASVANEIEECGRCKTASKLKAALRDINSEISSWPIELASIQEMQTRYVDLRGRKVKVKGTLSTTTYYNCRFRSQNKYRSLKLSEGFLGMSGIHVYCYRGEKGCEAIFEELASGGTISGTATLEYPTRNSICEEGQAYLLGWQ